jgi:hypothetical protein
MAELSVQDFAQAMLREDVEGVKTMLGAGAQLNWLVPWRSLELPAIFVAVLKCNEAIVRVLLEAGDSLQRTHNFQTPISYAVLLQQPEAFAFVLPMVKHHSSFNSLKIFKDVVQNNERRMYEELRRYFPIPPPERLALNDRPPLFYLKDLDWLRVSRFLFVYKHELRLRRLPEPLLRDICTY